MRTDLKEKFRDLIQNTNFIPFVLFTLSVLLYNYFYLHQGFEAHMDEGYLISLGKRITDGQIPYTDFYFLRPPLSIYLQACFISLLGDSHTIYIGRILFVFQTTLLVILNALIYKKHLNKIEFFFILIISYIITTLLLQFQWYSYDGLFFAGLSLFLLHKKQFIFTGVTIFLAAMSKQNYFLLLPGTIFVLLIFQKDYANIKTIVKEHVSKILIGFSLGAFITSLFFLLSGNLTLFIEQVFLLPKEIADISTQFALIQNNPEAIAQSLFSILAIIIIYHFHKNKIISSFLIAIIICFLYADFYNNVKYFIFNIIYINITAAILYLYNYNKKEQELPHTLLIFVPLTIIIQYLAGFSYGGLLFAYMGAGLMMPALYLILRKNKSLSIRAILVLLIIGGIGYRHKSNYIYQDSQREILNSNFSHPRLQSIISSERRTKYVDFITENVNNLSEPDDLVFFFPDYSSMYYITGRRNPTKIEWYYKLEFNDAMLKESVEDLEKNHPKIIFLNGDYIPKALAIFVANNYTLVDSSFDIKMYQPNIDSL